MSKSQLLINEVTPSKRDDDCEKEKNDVKTNFWSRVTSPRGKKNLRRAFLLLFVILYTSGGALMFQVFEYETDIIHIQTVKDNLQDSRSSFLQTIYDNSYLSKLRTDVNNNTEEDLFENGYVLENKERLFDEVLRMYEQKVEKSLKNGVSTSFLNMSKIDPRWSYTQSIFFAATVLTTIGYGNIAPSTHYGRVFCIVFALVGIPLTLTVIADIGDMLASLLPVKTLKKVLPKGRCKTVVTIFGTFGLLIFFIAFGGGLFCFFEDWSFLDAFYFCFITTTTIGFGDLVPATSSLLVCGVYIIVGLALTSTVIELVRRQYAASWDQMKLLTMRIHQLSGPLALAMKKMVETGTGEMEVDTALVRELQELNSALKEVQKASGALAEDNQEDPWQALLDMAAKKQRITVLMYESSL